MKRLTTLINGAGVLFFAIGVEAQVGISPLSTFGTGGWLNQGGTGSYTYLGSANNERGLAYGNGHLYLVSTTGGINIRILDPLTGVDLGALPTGTGIISGGARTVNAVGVGGDGGIYVANLTTQASTTPYTVYKWSTELSTPVVAYTGAPLAGARVGDTLTAFGSGSATRLAAGFGSTPSVTGNNGYAIIDPTAGTATAVGFSGGTPAAGDFRLGVTFADATHVYGSQGSTLARFTSFSGTTGTLLGSPALTTSAERPMSFATINGVSLLATVSTGDSRVRIYDASNPTSLLLLGTSTGTSSTANANGTGAVAWGNVVDNGNGTSTALLYAMNSNNGIEAFTVIVPEPGTAATFVLGMGLWVVARRFVRKA